MDLGPSSISSVPSPFSQVNAEFKDSDYQVKDISEDRGSRLMFLMARIWVKVTEDIKCQLIFDIEITTPCTFFCFIHGGQDSIDEKLSHRPG